MRLSSVFLLTVVAPSMPESLPVDSARVFEKLLPWATMACPAANSIATRRARKRVATGKIQQAHPPGPSDVHSRRLLRRRCPTPQGAGPWTCGQARLPLAERSCPRAGRTRAFRHITAARLGAEEAQTSQRTAA